MFYVGVDGLYSVGYDVKVSKDLNLVNGPHGGCGFAVLCYLFNGGSFRSKNVTKGDAASLKQEAATVYISLTDRLYHCMDKKQNRLGHYRDDSKPQWNDCCASSKSKPDGHKPFIQGDHCRYCTDCNAFTWPENLGVNPDVFEYVANELGFQVHDHNSEHLKRSDLVMNKERNHVSVVAKGVPAPISFFSTDPITDHYRTLMRTDDGKAVNFMDLHYQKYKDRKVNLSQFDKPSVTIPSCTIRSTETTRITMDEDCYLRKIVQDLGNGYKTDVKKTLAKQIKKSKYALSNKYKCKVKPNKLQKGWFKLEDQLRDCVVRGQHDLEMRRRLHELVKKVEQFVLAEGTQLNQSELYWLCDFFKMMQCDRGELMRTLKSHSMAGGLYIPGPLPDWMLHGS